MKRMSRIKGLNHRAAAADCMEEVEDAVEELGNSVAGPEFCRVISDVQSWVSAAETDDDTCTEEGFDEAAAVNRNVKRIVERHVGRISRFTSNALALVNLYGGYMRRREEL
ncbi:Pectinesterase inhibitor 10 [Linum perenne]